MGFPALPADQSLAKFGFSQLALVEKGGAAGFLYLFEIISN
jgi:hypothetical protein